MADCKTLSLQKNGKTPLHYAVEGLQLEAARFILGLSSGGGDADGTLDGASLPETETKKAEGMELLDASQQTKLKVKIRNWVAGFVVLRVRAVRRLLPHCFYFTPVSLHGGSQIVASSIDERTEE